MKKLAEFFNMDFFRVLWVLVVLAVGAGAVVAWLHDPESFHQYKELALFLLLTDLPIAFVGFTGEQFKRFIENKTKE